MLVAVGEECSRCLVEEVAHPVVVAEQLHQEVEEVLDHTVEGKS